jgi:cis-3-alkyl-4-acyloxetan-2-one decarboxylase
MVAAPIDRRRFRHLYPYQSNYLDRNGLKYHYIDEGQGDPILMVHGNPTWSFFFRSLIEAFRSGHRVIAPDHMGCGLSDKPPSRRYDFRLQSRIDDLEALMSHLNLDRPITLILHDWGGMIGLAWALEHLRQIGRVIIMNTAGFFPPHGKSIPMRLRLIRSRSAFVEKAVLCFNLFSRAAIHMAPHRRLPPDVAAGFLAPYNSVNNRLATLKFVQDIPLDPGDPSGRIVLHVQNNLYKFKQIQMMILWGAHDFVFDRDYYREWRRRFPNASAHWFSDAGHYLLEDVPDKIVPLIREFLHNDPCKC